ncbi:conserved hypothetical protein [Verrucomicrobia bacterium]|nr:conserved hypothetical protein [Verrucomicrobiota bacterium]
MVAGVARPLRIERPGAWYHVTTRGNERRAIFRDNRDRQHFCDLLGETVGTFGWRLPAYVLMDNHFHLLAETPQPNLGRGMQWLNTSYSVWFNRRHGRSGHLFQGRYKAIIVEPSAWGLELSRYIHLNPVRVGRLGLDKGARARDRAGVGPQPEPAQVKARTTVLRGYRWSSYRAYLGLAKAPEWLSRELLAQGQTKREESKRRESAAETYRCFVESALRQGLRESPWEKLTAQTALGGARFVQGLQRRLRGKGREQPGARQLANRPKLAQIIAAVAKVKSERWEDFRDRYGDWGRDLVLYLGRRHCGLKLAELGREVGGLDYMSVSIAIHRLGRRLEKDSALLTALNRCRTDLGM